MKKYVLKLTVLLATVTVLNSCNKVKNDTVAPDETEYSQSASDNNEVDKVMNIVADDANNLLQNSSNARLDVSSLICGGSIDSTSILKNFTITYDGSTTCNGRTKTGTVNCKLISGDKWSDAGAMLQITVTDLKVTRVRDSKSITINGKKVITNVTGGLRKNIASGDSLVHKVRGTVKVTFDNNTTRDWAVYRKRTFKNESRVYSVKLAGDSSIAGINIEKIGTNRYGTAFVSKVNAPVVFKSSCEYNAVSGEIVHSTIKKDVTITFGVDASGNVLTNTNDCPYGAKYTWTNYKGESKTAVVQY